LARAVLGPQPEPIDAPLPRQKVLELPQAMTLDLREIGKSPCP